jgi:hypothetical protein
MIYTDLDSLAVAAANTVGQENFARLGKLVQVYFDALENPPAGIIGVGAIAYAEQALIGYQISLIHLSDMVTE